MFEVNKVTAFCTKDCKYGKARKQNKAVIKASFNRKASEPTVRQESNWLARVTQYAVEHGAFPLGLRNNAFQRHHVKGRKCVQSKVHIGRWFVLPLLEDFHDVNSPHPENVTHFPARFENTYGTQVMMFLEMCEVIKQEDGCLPFGDDVLSVIEGLQWLGV